MPTSRTLTLFRPGGPYDGPIPALPPGLPRRFPEAGLLLNHGLLVAELLEVDTEAAAATLELAEGGPEGLIRALDEEDAGLLAPFFDEVAQSLQNALDPAGLPQGSAGSLLAASPLVTTDEPGRLILRSHRLPLIELRDRLPTLARYLRFAADHGLWALFD